MILSWTGAVYLNWFVWIIHSLGFRRITKFRRTASLAFEVHPKSRDARPDIIRYTAADLTLGVGLGSHRVRLSERASRPKKLAVVTGSLTRSAYLGPGASLLEQRKFNIVDHSSKLIEWVHRTEPI